MCKIIFFIAFALMSQIAKADYKSQQLLDIEKKANFYYNKAIYFVNKQKLKLAEKNYLQAIKLLPTHEFAIANLANTYSQMGLYEKATQYATQALQLDPSDEIAKHAHIKSLTLQKKWNEALDFAQKYENKNSDSEFLTTFSNIYGHLENKNKEAWSYALKALDKNSKNLQASQNAMIFAAREYDCSKIIHIYETYFSRIHNSESIWKMSYLSCKTESKPNL